MQGSVSPRGGTNAKVWNGSLLGASAEFCLFLAIDTKESTRWNKEGEEGNIYQSSR